MNFVGSSVNDLALLEREGQRGHERTRLLVLSYRLYVLMLMLAALLVCNSSLSLNRIETFRASVRSSSRRCFHQ